MLGGCRMLICYVGAIHVLLEKLESVAWLVSVMRFY
jgi:hypothetical protein